MLTSVGGKSGRKAIWISLAIGWVVLTHLPKIPAGPVRIPHLDKLVHFAGYFVLSSVGLWSMAVRRFDPRQVSIWLLCFALFAMADELTQPWFGRGAEILDWVADMAGVGVSLRIGRAVSRRMNSPDGR